MEQEKNINISLGPIEGEEINPEAPGLMSSIHIAFQERINQLKDLIAGSEIGSSGYKKLQDELSKAEKRVISWKTKLE